MEEMNTVFARLGANVKHVRNEPEVPDRAAESDVFFQCILVFLFISILGVVLYYIQL